MEKEWIETASGNRISKKSGISGASNILLAGNTTICPDAKLEANVKLNDKNQAAIQVGKFTYFSSHVDITPPFLGYKKVAIPISAAPNSTSSNNNNSQESDASSPQTTKVATHTKTQLVRIHNGSKIGSFVYIGPHTKVRSATIGNRVRIEANCYIGNLSVIYSCCVIKQGTVVPDNMVIPAYSYVEGKAPNLRIIDLPNGFRRSIEDKARELYLGVEPTEADDLEFSLSY